MKPSVRQLYVAADVGTVYLPFHGFNYRKYQVKNLASVSNCNSGMRWIDDLEYFAGAVC